MESNCLQWDEVLPAAEEAFRVWTHGRELEWAREAWGRLAAAGLTAYATEIERCRAAIRILTLAQVYLDWCSLADEESCDDELECWADGLDIPSFRLGQIVGEAKPLEGEDDDALRSEALRLLARRARRGVVKALVEGFGGESGLFLSLWRINHPAPEPVQEVRPPPRPNPLRTTPQLSLFEEPDEPDEEEDENDDESYLDDGDEEDDWAVLNVVTGNKMAGFEWISEGCPLAR